MTNTRHSTLTRIEPKRGWFRINLPELWHYRELFYFLTWRDIKVRYKQTLIGVLWVVLQPILTTAIFTVLFSRYSGFTTYVPYALFTFAGLLIWLFTHTAISMASASFVNHTNLVTKVYFPRLIVPAAATLASLFDLIVVLPILALLQAYYGITPSSSIVFFPVFIVLALINAAAVGTLFAALNIRFRDVKFALPFLLQVWMIATPIFYPITVLSERWRMIFALNPLTGIIEGIRSSIFGEPFDWQLIGISVMSMLVVTMISLFVFSRMEDDFADVI